eukprot:gene3937-7147_t
MFGKKVEEEYVPVFQDNSVFYNTGEPDGLKDYYKTWSEKQNKAFETINKIHLSKTEEQMKEQSGEFLAKIAVRHTKGSDSEKQLIDENMQVWSSQSKGEHYIKFVESPEYYQAIKGSEMDIAQLGVDALAIPNDVLEQWSKTGRVVTVSTKPLAEGVPDSSLELAKRYFGDKIGRNVFYVDYLARRNGDMITRTNQGENFMVKVWLLLGVGSLIFKWIYIRERENMRQRTKLAYRLSDPSIRTENGLAFEERHKEWLMTYHEEDDEEDDEDEE